MASVAPANDRLLEWPKEDKRQILYFACDVTGLEAAIKFHTECLGMRLVEKGRTGEKNSPACFSFINECTGFLSKKDNPKEKYPYALVRFGQGAFHFGLKLIEIPGVNSHDIGTGFGHFTIEIQDVHKAVEDILAKGGTVIRQASPLQGGTTVIAFVEDPNGYPFELIQRGPNPEPLCRVTLKVGNLERSIKFYEKALGMRLLRKIDEPPNKRTLAMMGYADKLENEKTVLALAYDYDVTEYTKGNAFEQIAIGTDDVYKSAEAVKLVIEELGGTITREPGPIPGVKTKMTSFEDPEGWKIVLVDNEDFLKELQ